jgi:hypothetical protein
MRFLLDVWGEGRITDEGLVTGFNEALNLNHRNQRISNGPDKGKPIPNLFPVDDYENPKFPDDTFQYITLMGAPISVGTAKGMCRVLNASQGYIYLYDPNASDFRTFEGIAASSDIVLKKRVPPTSLSGPFNQITIQAVCVFAYRGHDEL